MRVAGYQYAELLRAVAERDRGQCWVRGLLLAKREAQIKAWNGGQADGLDPGARNWVPGKLLECDGPWDADHLGLSKSWLKSALHTAWTKRPPGLDFWAMGDRVFVVPYEAAVAEVLNDPRDCVLTCRRHHDMRGNGLVVVRRADLPEHVEEFAAELGGRAVARLERDFGPVGVRS
jgi:hypothetical protein